MCAWTKNLVKSGDEWIRLEKYLKDELDIKVSHGISPAAREALLKARKSLGK